MSDFTFGVFNTFRGFLPTISLQCSMLEVLDVSSLSKRPCGYDGHSEMTSLCEKRPQVTLNMTQFICMMWIPKSWNQDSLYVANMIEKVRKHISPEISR